MKYHTWEQFIADTLTDDVIIAEMISNFEELQHVGCIGECPLRTAASVWCSNCGNAVSVTPVMRDIVTDCYKHFTNKYFDLRPALRSPMD